MKRIYQALVYSIQGLVNAYRNELAFRQEVWLISPLMIVAWLIGRNYLEILILWAVMALILIVELCNSAIEALSDRIDTKHNLLLQRAKDMASAAVFLAIVLAIATWLLLLYDIFYLGR